jgi:hypothetical protein
MTHLDQNRDEAKSFLDSAKLMYHNEQYAELGVLLSCLRGLAESRKDLASSRF